MKQNIITQEIRTFHIYAKMKKKKAKRTYKKKTFLKVNIFKRKMKKNPIA